MSETTEPDGKPAPEPEPTPGTGPAGAPESTPPETDEPAPAREAEEERQSRGDRRFAELTARLSAAERREQQREQELAFYRQQAQQQPPADETPEQRYHRERAAIRAEVETEIRKETFHNQGRAAFPDWEQRCGDLIKMGADANFAALLVEMPEGPRVAAALAADPAEVERIANLRSERARAVALGKYAASIEDAPNGHAAPPPQVTRAPAPIRPVTGRASPQFNEYTAPPEQLVDVYLKRDLDRARGAGSLVPASDPTMGVATPAGVLQGVAAFSWDGSAWQPSGRAGPAVATTAGVLQGIAPFSWSGSAWTPAGRAQPGVATPTGVLDGVAVYTWSGSAWTPASGTATPATPGGALRGVAAFSWDGAAWQPSGQARASVPTPYGVLDGVAMFEWGGSAWQAGAAVPAGATLDLSFMSGTLNPQLTFTRASTATYFDATGTMQTAATNAPRFDYDPVTHGALGLLIEEQRQNLWLQSGDASNAAWIKGGSVVVAPTVTANQVAAPDGTLTAARAVFPQVIGGGALSVLAQSVTATAAAYTFSVWLRGNAGGEQLYLGAVNAALYYSRLITLTTAWQRYTLTTSALTAAGWFFQVGTDLRDGAENVTSGNTLYVWGAQIEPGAFPTSYIPTTAAAVTRSADLVSMPTAAWFTAAAGTYQSEFVPNGVAAGLPIIISGNAGSPTVATGADSRMTAGVRSGAAVFSATGPLYTFGAVNKAAFAYLSGASTAAVNGTAFGPSATALTVTGTVVEFGSDGVTPGNNALNGYIRRVRYWPRVLSTAELQQVTT